MRFARLMITGLSLAALAATGCGLAATLPLGRAVERPQARQLPGSYYASAEGKRGQELLRALNAIVARHTDLGYNDARDAMFAEVDDPDRDDVVGCIYIGRELSGVRNRGTAFRNGSGLNAEHTWPQSKGAEGVAKADLHHLFPSDIHANSTRGSFPFGEVAQPDWAEGGSQRGTDATGETVFEPRPEQKGNTARALLYFYTVYGLDGRIDMVNFRHEEEVLKRWHAADPVDAGERSRNDAVQKFQGNRNPYVDRPEFVEAVGTFLPARAFARR